MIGLPSYVYKNIKCIYVSEGKLKPRSNITHVCLCTYMYVHELTEVYRNLLLGENVLSKDSSVLS